MGITLCTNLLRCWMTTKSCFKQILTAFTKNYKFNPEIFASSEV